MKGRGCYVKEMHIAVSCKEGHKGLVASIKLNQFHIQYCTIAQPSWKVIFQLREFSLSLDWQFIVNFLKFNIIHFWSEIRALTPNHLLISCKARKSNFSARYIKLWERFLGFVRTFIIVTSFLKFISKALWDFTLLWLVLCFSAAKQFVCVLKRAFCW